MITLAKNGPIVLGGCVTGNIEDLVEGKGYRLDASLLNSWKGVRPLPVNVGRIYNCVIDLKFYQTVNQKETLINELPKEDGNVTICFAIPPNHEGTIYFLDKYFNENAEWVAVGGPYLTGIACGPVMKSGYYGMVDVPLKGK